MFGSCATRSANTREVIAIGGMRAPFRSRMPTYACGVNAGLFTGIRGDIRSNRGNFAIDGMHQSCGIAGPFTISTRAPADQNKTVRRPHGRSHRQSAHER